MRLVGPYRCPTCNVLLDAYTVKCGVCKTMYTSVNAIPFGQEDPSAQYPSSKPLITASPLSKNFDRGTPLSQESELDGG